MPYLGQHFLKNKSALKRIVAALNIKDDDFIIEIGPGHGELTDIILANPASFSLILVEKDHRLFESLKQKYLSTSRVTVIAADIRDFLSPNSNYLPSSSFPSHYKVVGNIPYYLTGRLLRLLGEHPPAISVLTVQKEVGEKLTPPPGRYNLLAASVDCWGKTKIISRLSARDFSPAPKVNSVSISIISKKPPPISSVLYFKVARAAFHQPRKFLVNNLSRGLSLEKSVVFSILSQLGISPTARPGNLDFNLLVKLTYLLDSQLKKSL